MYMKRNRKKIIFLSIIGLLFLVLIVTLTIKTYNKFSDLQKTFEDDLPVRYSLFNEDSNLISKKYVNSLRGVESYSFKNKERIAFASINDDYILVIHRLKVTKSLSLQKNVKISLSDTKYSTGFVYSVFKDRLPIELSYLTSTVKQEASELFLTIQGDSLHNITKADSALGYSFLFKNFSLRYARESPIEIFIRKKKDILGVSDPISMSILFLKKNGKLYFFALVSTVENRKVDPMLLFEIINK
jgi:hypothetical protein